MKKFKFLFIAALCSQIASSLLAADIAGDPISGEQSFCEPATPLCQLTFNFPHWVNDIKFNFSEKFHSEYFYTHDSISYTSIPKAFVSEKDWTGQLHSYIRATIHFYPQLLICSSEEQCNLLSKQIRDVRIVTKDMRFTMRATMQSVGSYKDNRRTYEKEFTLEAYMNSISKGNLSIYPLLHEKDGSFYLSHGSNIKEIVTDPQHSAHNHVLVVERVN